MKKSFFDHIKALFYMRKPSSGAKGRLLTPHSTVGFSPATTGIETLVFVSTISLMVMGLLAIYTASSMKGFHQLDDSYVFVRKQLYVALVGLALMSFVTLWVSSSKAALRKSMRVFLRVFEKSPLIIYVMILCLLALVLVPGMYSEIGGAKRWMTLAGVRFQASELAKLALVLLMARHISRPSFRIKDVRSGPLSCGMLFLGYAVFLMLQPDFGTTVLLAAVCFMMLWVAGLPRVVMSGLVGVGLVLMSVMIVIAPYRLKRILAFLDPWSQVRGGGFQIIQSYVGFQNGGLWGRGLGESKQKLFFLPEAHTDFILPVIGEELGLVGVLFVVLSFSTLIYCGFRITQKQKDGFWYFTCLGITLTLSIQSVFNMGVAMGLLPTKGIPLPFISNGASSLVVYVLMVCILLVANKRYPIKELAGSLHKT